VRTGSPAETAGVRPGWIVESVGGLSVDSLAAWVREGAASGGEARAFALWLPVSARNRLAGPPGSTVTVELRTGEETRVHLTLPRAAPEGEEVRFGTLPPLRMET